jgi:hypothetical protein
MVNPNIFSAEIKESASSPADSRTNYGISITNKVSTAATSVDFANTFKACNLTCFSSL